MTVKKPSNGFEPDDHLQKSAKTNTNTTAMPVSLLGGIQFTPRDKNAAARMSDVDNYSDKFTPDNVNSTPDHAL